MSKRQLTFRYIFFYVLFLPDSWQVLIGLIAAYFLAPLVRLPDGGASARAMIFIMIGVIGYAACRRPARWFTRTLIRLILGEKQLWPK